jgi:subtilisin
LARLRLDPRVREVVGAPNISLIRPVGSAVEISDEKITWGLKHLGIPQLWAEGLTGTGVLVGHLDTGIDGDHPAFGAINGLPRAIYSFVTVDEFGDPPERGTSHAPVDSDDHGTHTAGTVVGRPVGGTAFGVAPGAQLLSAMVIEAGNHVARILAGMNWAVENGARILSLSLGFRGFREDFLPVMDAVLQRGVLPVIAIGNEGVGTSRSPGNYQRLLSVGASDRNNRVPDFSSSQTLQHPAPNRVAPDLVAPGEDILSANVGGGTRLDSGTSMATPHVAGLAALLMEACPDATAQQVQTAIFQSCYRPATMSRSRANRGAPDGLRALAILRSLPGVNAQPAKPVHPALTGFVPTGAAAPTDTPDGGEPERPQRGRAAKQKRVVKADDE